MAVSIDKARAFVYGNGVLWERALFGYLFDGRPLEHVLQCLACYKNPDGGWGHGLEHDIACPDSHPPALEYLLVVQRLTGLPLGDLLSGAAAWVEANRNPDGSLRNPDVMLDYPLAPWWQAAGGQTVPASLTGNLLRLGLCSADLAESTRRWVQANLTPADIRANEWQFSAFHPLDYFWNVPDFPDLAAHKQAALDNLIMCAEAAPEKQYLVLFQVMPGPESEVAQAVPASLITRNLDYLLEAQQEDGHWDDEHGLPRWWSYATISALLTLRRYGRLA